MEWNLAAFQIQNLGFSIVESIAFSAYWLRYSMSRIKIFPLKNHGLLLTSGLSLTTLVAYWQEWSLIDSTGLSLTDLPLIDNSGLTNNRCVSLETVVSHWQQVSLMDNSGISLTTGVSYWQQWSLVDNRFLLLTTVVCRWQQISLTDNSGISLTIGVSY